MRRRVVVRSAGPSAKSYPPGKALPDNAKIALQPGDSVTVVGAKQRSELCVGREPSQRRQRALQAWLAAVNAEPVSARCVRANSR